jgi:hypothetical protein
MSDNSAEMTDVMAQQHWVRILEDAQRIMDHGLIPVQPGSELAEDDAKSNPYQVSHCAQEFINTGLDHMHAVKTLILGDEPVIHANADYTLLRGALENFGVAFWVLQPSARRYRIERALQCAAQNFKDQDKATKDLGLEDHRPLQSNLAKIDALCAPAGCDKKAVRKGYVSTEVLQYAERETGANPSPYLMWQLCSGFAHGRQWASLGMNAVEMTPGPGESVQTVRFTSDYKRLLAAGWPAHILMCEAFRLLNNRAA